MQFANAVITTSGTAFDFENIPAGTTEMVFILDGTSLNNLDSPIIQLGDADAFVSTGYAGTNTLINNATPSPLTMSSGFLLGIGGNNARINYATAHFFKPYSDSETWFMTSLSGAGAVFTSLASGRVEIPSELTRVRLTRTGSNTFDAGKAVLGWRT